MLEESANYADHLNSVYLECHHVAIVTSFEYLKCKILHMVDSITDRHAAEQAFKVALLIELEQSIPPEVCNLADDDAFIRTEGRRMELNKKRVASNR